MPPPYCSACHNRPAGRFVDFDAAYEGPSFAAGVDADADVRGGMVVTSDDLILCEGCVKSAAETVGYGDAAALEQRLTEMQDLYDQLSDRAAAQAAHIDQLEQAVATRTALDTAMNPPESAPPVRQGRAKTRKAAA